MKRLSLFMKVIVLTGLFMMGAGQFGYCDPIPKNGVQKRYYDNGNLKFAGWYKQGQLVRKKAFYRNGKVKLDHKFKDGQIKSVKNFYENGKRKSIWTKRSGKTKIYNRDGKLRTVVNAGSS